MENNLRRYIMNFEVSPFREKLLFADAQVYLLQWAGKRLYVKNLYPMPQFVFTYSCMCGIMDKKITR